MKRVNQLHRYAFPTLLLLVFLIAAAKAGESVSIKGLKYDPARVTVKVGQSVSWSNDDDHDHTVTADDDSFDSKKLGSGEKFEHKFTKKGAYSYHCKYHPRMTGTVVVTD